MFKWWITVPVLVSIAVTPAQADEVKTTQWDLTPKSMFELIAEGYEIKTTTNNIPAAVMSSIMISTTHILQKGTNTARCTESYRNNLPARDGSGQPFSVFYCSLLVKPHVTP
jgi:hypothetical protein